jgi:hypothetical protein
MAKAKKQKGFTHKVTISADAGKQSVKVTTSPSLKRCSLQDHQTLVNVLLAGVDLGLKELLGALPVLRPASAEEKEAQVYVFKDEEKDNKLYNERKNMYNAVAQVFEGTLSELFPDIEYIDNSIKNRQEIIFDMSKEEAEQYQEEMEELTKRVREATVEEGKE